MTTRGTLTFHSIGCVSARTKHARTPTPKFTRCALLQCLLSALLGEILVAKHVHPAPTPLT